MRFLLIGINFDEEGSPGIVFRQEFKSRHKAAEMFNKITESQEYLSVQLLNEDRVAVLVSMNKEGKEYVEQILGEG